MSRKKQRRKKTTGISKTSQPPAPGLSRRTLAPSASREDPTQPPADELSYRALAVSTRADGTPETLDEESRSVEVVGATENPVPVFDWDRMEVVREVLLMSGVQMPENRQITLLDSHSRWNTTSILGSYRQMAVEGDKLVGRGHFSEAEEAQGPWQKVREGHLTDFSLGYKVHESTYIPEGQTQKIDGRTFEGPLKVSTSWTPRELSACPIGADEMAKTRAATALKPTTTDTKKEVDKMDERIREFLESRGLPKTATEEEAYRFLEGLDVKAPPVTDPPGTAAEVDEDKVRAEATAAEQARILEIRAMCEQTGHQDLADGLVTDNSSLDEARKTVLEQVVAKAPTTGGAGYRPPVEIVAEERDKFRDAARDSILIRSGSVIEAPAAGADDLTGYSLRELARESLRFANQAMNGNPMEMIGRALTTSDFPILLANVAHKSLFEGFDAASETWPVWCETGSVSDFKTHTSARASETDDLDEIREDDEYRYGSRTEAKEEYKIATYGKLFKISRQTIINDDLNALTDTPSKHGEAASRKVGDVVYAVITANSAMGDGVALFHANHSNLGTAGVLSETTIAEMIKLMKLQKDLKGKRRLNIRPLFYLGPVALEGSAEIFFNSGQFAGANAAATRNNPYAGTRFTRVYEPRLDDDSATAWYLAGPRGKTVKVFFLNGNQMPYLETKQGWNVDGVEYKVRIDAGAKAMDWKALTKNAGA